MGSGTSAESSKPARDDLAAVGLDPAQEDGSPALAGPLPIGVIGAAREQMSRIRSRSVEPPPALTAHAVEQALGFAVESCELLHMTWNNRIYRVRPVQGPASFAKQFWTLGEAALVREYEALRSLCTLAIEGLSMPQPLGLVASHRSYLMAGALGRPIALLALDPALEPACKLAGAVLGRIHSNWTQSLEPLPAAALAQDLAAMPLGQSAAEGETIRAAVSRLAGECVAIGKTYSDFSPRNVFYADGAVSLIDPPEDSGQGLLLWDVATFCGGLRRAAWRSPAKWSPSRCRAVADRGQAAFLAGYASGYPGLYAKRTIPPGLLRLLELQRIGQLMTHRTQQLRLMLGRDGGPFARRGRLLQNLAKATLSLSSLAVQRRAAVRQIAHSLAAAE